MFKTDIKIGILINFLKELSSKEAYKKWSCGRRKAKWPWFFRRTRII